MRMVKLIDRVLQLSVKDAPISNHYNLVKERLVSSIVHVRKAVA
jgi:hypothetical protein